MFSLQLFIHYLYMVQLFFFPKLFVNLTRHYDDKAAEVAQGFWNCPCVPMRERYVYELHFQLFFL
jgi:hypothetical protein